MRSYIITLCCLTALLTGCFKDKGNYDYNLPEAPQVVLDSVYNVFVGDSLIVEPEISFLSKDSLSFEWRIGVPDPDIEDVVDSGSTMRVRFGLGAQRYQTKLTITNEVNGMKYFHYFIVSGKTAFSSGTVILSEENGLAQVSFIKPDGTVQPGIYTIVNPEDALPTEPTQLLAVPEARLPGTVRRYWVFGKSGAHTGVEIDANTFRKTRFLADLFFDPPATILPEKMFANPQGVITGVVNGRLQAGTTNTWDQAPTYGMFGLGASGDYELSPELVFNYLGVYGPGNYIGFDKLKKQFVRINLYGDPTFFGPAYTVVGDAFNPLSLGMDLEKVIQINGGLCYAYARSGGVLQELKFNTNFNGPFEFTPMLKRAFLRPELLTATTLWASTPNEVIYFSSGDKVYRYNPSNDDFRVLNTSFNGKAITMLKVLTDNVTLAVGVEGSLYYLNINTGVYGDLLQKIDGLPGKVLDQASRNQ
ncbi:MAG: PKD-like family lipoprotein [Candidatus Pseudobacter hemicellulosilyticus]|uniref:PKD-like family lipoprotein n=1 Tax=Candidatus Pseudobacter hemicellulosilyticus TaxID=3121375 RepID=A0AAJ5WX24_9BACT|nr:MAG: PKD-like family lipoprotein [Pseudobacter sp.]